MARRLNEEDSGIMTQFNDIFGQDAAIDWLRRAYLSERLPHGLIFAGPVGVGKATTARALARLWLCERARDADSCGTCPSCVAFDAGTHGDYHVITKELIRFHDATGKSKGIELSIQVIRPELIEPASRKPVQGRGKFFVVEQAELMTAAAQNALLKTLEEPAGRAVIVLITDQPGVLLSTIRSRCQVVKFVPLSEMIIERELRQRGIDSESAASAVRWADGSLGVALRWIKDDVIGPAGELARQVDGILAGRMPEDWPGWFRKSAEAYAGKQLERDPLGSKDQATREGLSTYLRLAGEQVRRRLVEQEAGQHAYCAAIESLADAERYLDANVSIPLVFQNLAATLERRFRAK
jgi:DNA polymerase III delta' subunit